LQPCSEDPGDNLHDTVLEGDGAEAVRSEHNIFLRQQGNKSPVKPVEGGNPIKEILEEGHEVRTNHIPKSAEESRPEAIGAGAAVCTHRPYSVLGFLEGKRCFQALQTRNPMHDSGQIESPNRPGGGAKEANVEVPKQFSFFCVVVQYPVSIMQDLNLILPEACGGTGMEEFSVVFP
jgi:hypothetical protein